MSASRVTYVALLSLILLFSVIACMAEKQTDTTSGTTPSTDAPEASDVGESEQVKEAEEFLKKAAQEAQEPFLEMEFSEFLETVYKEPFEGGKYIVNGDTAFTDEKRLREFFGSLGTAAAPGVSLTNVSEEGMAEGLAVNQAGGLDTIWNNALKGNLTYCVSTGFGGRYNSVVAAMDSAGNAWEGAAAVDLRHDSSQDGDCTAANGNVVFDVRPVNVNGQYLARAFFPDDPRGARNVLIDDTSFSLNPGGKLTLTGILRHELGHALGFRHEHTRPESGACFEDANWRPIGNYDPFSVMHYPQCNGRGDWSLTLTALDRAGSACLYGPAEGFTIDPSLVTDPGECASAGGPGEGEPRTESFPSKSVARGEEDQYGPFAVAANTIFDATMTGSGDPDLYVRFGAAPAADRYDCRPYLSSGNETCAVNVPAGQSQAFVMVRGYRDGSYSLTVTHTP